MPVKVHGNMTILSVRVYCFCYMIRYVVRNVGLYSVDHGFILFFVCLFPRRTEGTTVGLTHACCADPLHFRGPLKCPEITCFPCGPESVETHQVLSGRASCFRGGKQDRRSRPFGVWAADRRTIRNRSRYNSCGTPT